ncbi:hypothetical protein QAD02_013448 [Eretmocerus hayati]|uniref:Uncharacterized protein n=1 Tax=Eretmocerus hayati TaxID=131215 RepID=A0ACC2P2K5_9HYME|nr:hypothetical protein QAD02_013448 [Eretmocerus hayati]
MTRTRDSNKGRDAGGKIQQGGKEEHHYRSSRENVAPSLDFGSIRVPHHSVSKSPGQIIGADPLESRTTDEDDPLMIRDTFLANPDQLSLLRQNNPRLAEALLSGDLGEPNSYIQDHSSQNLQR